MTKTAAEWRAMAGERERSAQESFERCDTDGFLSQWASGITADLLRKKAELVEAGGVWTFPALFDAEGKRLPAVLMRRPDFGRPWMKSSVWMIEDPKTGRVVEWVPAFKKGPRSKRAKLGYVEGHEQAPAEVFIRGEGHGLSGHAWAETVRMDGGYPGRSSGNFNGAEVA